MSSLLLSSDAERMDLHYRLQLHVYDLTREYYLLGRRHLIGDLAPGHGQSVIEIGCGTAWNLAHAARAYPEAILCGVDVSHAMLETASASLARKGLAGRIALGQGDATGFDPQALFARAHFDRVFISYALSMIPAWGEALDHAAAMVAPGGSLHIVDFGQCERLPDWFRKALFAFLRRYSVTPRPDLEARCREVADRHGLSVHFTRRYRGYGDYAVLRRPG